MKKKDEIKVCLVGSSGGHLTHLYMLKPFWKDKNRFWVTFDKEDARSLLEGEKVYPCYFPTNRSIKALIKNTKIAWDVLHKEKPDLIISCGAAVAVPFFYIGKMMGAKLVYDFKDCVSNIKIAMHSMTIKTSILKNMNLLFCLAIHELLRQGEYAPQAVLDAARQNALQEHAQTLAYMERDLADGVAEAVFQDAPCILYDLDGYYTGLRMLLSHMIETGLSSEERQERIYFAKDLTEIKTILNL